MVQVRPIKPASKATGTKRLKLRHDVLLSNVAFNFNLRRSNLELPFWTITGASEVGRCTSTLYEYGYRVKYIRI